MAALVRVPTGMGTEDYSSVAGQTTPSLRAAPGFRMHLAYASSEGVVVLEIWDSAEQHWQWFDENVRPHLPPGAELAHEVTELHNVIQP